MAGEAIMRCPSGPYRRPALEMRYGAPFQRIINNGSVVAGKCSR